MKKVRFIFIDGDTRIINFEDFIGVPIKEILYSNKYKRIKDIEFFEEEDYETVK